MESREFMELLKQFQTMNQENQKAMAEHIVNLIQHPPQSKEEIEAQKRLWAERVEIAKLAENMKAQKRKHCAGKADPNLPHRYPDNMMWGMNRGESLIVWQYTQFSSRGPNGELLLSPPTPVGVCKWCFSEFKPGDPDYQEAISWGGLTMAGQYQMNIRTGDAVSA